MTIIEDYPILSIIIAILICLLGFFVFTKPIGVAIVITMNIIGMTVLNDVNLLLALIFCVPLATIPFIKF